MENKYKVIVTKPLEEKLKRIRFSEWERFEKLKKKLEINPFAGKRLKYNLFEKKWGAFRIYYIIIEDMLVVILIDYSHKKDQRAKIDYILWRWTNFISELRKEYLRIIFVSLIVL